MAKAVSADDRAVTSACNQAMFDASLSASTFEASLSAFPFACPQFPMLGQDQVRLAYQPLRLLRLR